MDSGDAGALSPRGRAALPWIAAAIAIIVVTSLLYLHATAPPVKTAYVPPPPTPTVPGQYSVTYDFVTPSLGWSLVWHTNQDSQDIWIFRTTDGTAHWRQQLHAVVQDSTPTLQFFDRSNGVVVATAATVSSFFQTSDGGSHWRRTDRSDIAGDVFFSDPKHAWNLDYVAEADSAPAPQLLVTADGGQSWTQGSIPAPATGNKLYGTEVAFRADGEGWTGAAGTQTDVYLTRDFGRTWATIPVPGLVQIGPIPPPGSKEASQAGYFQTQVELLPRKGVLATVLDYAGHSTTYKSFDLGDTWHPLPPLPNQVTLADLGFFDATHWWAFKFGYLFKTADAGTTWHETKVAPLDENWNYDPANVIDSRHAWAVMHAATGRLSGSALSMTSDGGATWHDVEVPKLPA